MSHLIGRRVTLTQRGRTEEDATIVGFDEIDDYGKGVFEVETNDESLYVTCDSFVLHEEVEEEEVDWKTRCQQLEAENAVLHERIDLLQSTRDALEAKVIEAKTEKHKAEIIAENALTTLTHRTTLDQPPSPFTKFKLKNSIDIDVKTFFTGHGFIFLGTPTGLTIYESTGLIHVAKDIGSNLEFTGGGTVLSMKTALCCHEDGVVKIDLANLKITQIEGITRAIQDIAVSENGFAYLITSDGTMVIAQYLDGSFIQISEFVHPAYRIAYHNSHLYHTTDASHYEGFLTVLSTANPYKPYVVTRVNVSSKPLEGIVIKHRMVYAASWDSKVYRVDVTHPERPVVVPPIVFPDCLVHDIAVLQNHACVAMTTREGYLQLVEVEDLGEK